MKIEISAIKEMELRSAKVPGVVSLAQGIPSFDTPECIKRRAIDAIRRGLVSKYSLSSGMLELREAIEYQLSQENIFYDFEKEIIVTAGSIEAITATFLALLSPEDEVLIADPAYTSYQSAIKVARAKPVFVPLDEKKGWAVNINDFKKKITKKTKAILICNPNNPTGTIYTRSQLLQLAELAEFHNLYILADEAYKDFVFDEIDYFSLAQLASFRKRLIYIFSFSKAYAMTGWRVGFLATDKQNAQKILGVHDALVACAPVVSQWGALAALEMASQNVLDFKRIFMRRRNLISAELDKLSEWFHYEKPNSAYFVFPAFSKKMEKLIKKIQEKYADVDYDLSQEQSTSISWQFALNLLYHAKVAVVPGLAFGPTGEGHVRLCFGREEADIHEALRRLSKFIQAHKNL